MEQWETHFQQENLGVLSRARNPFQMYCVFSFHQHYLETHFSDEEIIHMEQQENAFKKH